MDEIHPVTGLEEPSPRALPHLPRLRAGRLFGLVLVVGSTALMGAALWHVLHIGTCASGGPYVSARPCPHGTALWIAAFPVGMLAWFAGMAFVGGLRERDEPPAPAGGWMPPVAGAWVGDASATSPRDPG